MNPHINKLFEIAQKKNRFLIGLMSGTSLDGLDIAYCKISNAGLATQVELLQFETISYSEDIKKEIRKVFAQKTIDFQHLAILNEWIALLHGHMVLDCLKKWNIPVSEVDLIASHGQTVMHAPKILHQIEKFPNATLQIGDGDHLAVTTGCITVSDFRQKHVAGGGEGAPLAVYGDYFLFGSTTENRILLNIGGISNFTLLQKSGDFEKVFVTDTGTGNTLLDYYTRLHYPELSYDKDAEIASKGTINKALLAELKSHPFFQAPFPKSTGPELFSKEFLEHAIQTVQTSPIAVPDVLATLTRFTAETIAEAILEVGQERDIVNKSTKVYISGGGLHNPLLMQHLKEILPFELLPTAALGINSDAKEAILFALLANETVAGHENYSAKQSKIPMIRMGKISFPN